MSVTAKTAKEFEAWLDANKSGWPDDLVKAGTFALLSLKEIELNKSNPPAKANAMKSSAQYVAAFEDAYAKWKAG